MTDYNEDLPTMLFSEAVKCVEHYVKTGADSLHGTLQAIHDNLIEGFDENGNYIQPDSEPPRDERPPTGRNMNAGGWIRWIETATPTWGLYHRGILVSRVVYDSKSDMYWVDYMRGEFIQKSQSLRYLRIAFMIGELNPETTAEYPPFNFNAQS